MRPTTTLVQLAQLICAAAGITKPPLSGIAVSFAFDDGRQRKLTVYQGDSYGNSDGHNGTLVHSKKAVQGSTAITCRVFKASLARIEVRISSSKKIEVLVEEQETVLSVKRKVHDRAGIPVEIQRLVAGGKNLEDHWRLRAHVHSRNSIRNAKGTYVVHLEARLLGGAARSAERYLFALSKRLNTSSLAPVVRVDTRHFHFLHKFHMVISYHLFMPCACSAM